MNGLRRAIVLLFGAAIAIAAGLIVFPMAALVDPVTREAGYALAEFTFFAFTRSQIDGLSMGEEEGLFHFVWAAVMAICVAPVVFAALIGEIARVRSFLWYAGATGFIAACAPWVIRAAFHTQRATSASPDELRFAIVFFFTGIVSGAVFWFIAGNSGHEANSAPN
ncbi:hypothetical protein [Methylocapsa aurea]|uniref:hypothetical protein n=1 Tax=Methylocapsa aurea TaxID=663610 RepID=UPI000690167B|nr:hypothetical protein [Methylocapsa aurea]